MIAEAAAALQKFDDQYDLAKGDGKPEPKRLEPVLALMRRQQMTNEQLFAGIYWTSYGIHRVSRDIAKEQRIEEKDIQDLLHDGRELLAMIQELERRAVGVRAPRLGP